MSHLSDMHFEQRFRSAEVSSEVNLLLREQFKAFYELGIKEKSSDIKSYIKLLEVNILNQKISDADFRSLTADVLKNLELKL